MREFFVIAGTVLFLNSIAYSNTESKEVKKEATVGHCEKMGSKGENEDIEAKDKAECKAKGGKWNKKSKDEHGHSDGDGHDHKK